MSQPNVLAASAPPTTGGSRGLICHVCTHNPFYVISAGLFLGGLWISFGEHAEAEDTWALMSGLAGYTLLLAATACLLVRFANVWDDVRTVLLLVVLMFLATSVTFDEVLAMNPQRGFACYIGGLLLAVVVSEGVLRGIRLLLPAWFRVPYYLILALFFLYPLALSPLLDQPRSAALMWGLFAFSPAAGLVFLTLLPAIRRGPHYVSNNGSPWHWPLYPWVLFGLFACAVPTRAFLLCWFMQPVGFEDMDLLIIGPYFLVPFGLAVAVLLLEIGVVSGYRGVLWIALAAPAGLMVLARFGHRPDPIYQEFLQIFSKQLGGDPLFLTLLASAGFYTYAALRRVPLATEALTGALAALAVVGPNALNQGAFMRPQAAPILLAAGLQLGLGLRGRDSWRCLIGAAGLVAIAVLAIPDGTGAPSLRGPIAFHLALVAVLIVGAAFDDALARSLRVVGAVLVLLPCLAVMFVPFDYPASLPPWALDAYPLVMSAIVAGYGQLLGHRPALGIAALVPACWLGAESWRGYRALRQIVTGLDYLAVSLALFALAILVSLCKGGVLARWIAARRGRVPHSTE